MNALIVDDDKYVVIALEKQIDWQVLGIDNVFTAYSSAKAREIIQNNSIDILLSDIDMPQGSGLELLEYLREEGYNIPTIFLTNYADFSYAKRALELKSFHYYLKPIDYEELTIIIKDALAESLTNASKNKTAINQLWFSYLLQKKYPPLSFVEKINAFDSAISTDSQFVVALFQLYPYYLKNNRQLMCRYQSLNDISEQLKKLFDSVFGAAFSSLGIFLPYQIEKELILTVIPVAENDASLYNSLKSQAEEVIFATREKLGLHCTFFMSKVENLAALPDALDRLNKLREANANNIDKVLTLSHFEMRAMPQPFDSDVLLPIIKAMDIEQFKTVLLKYVAKCKASGTLTGTQLSKLRFETNQVLYSYLNEAGILSPSIIDQDTYQFFSKNISLSEYYFNLYVDYVGELISEISPLDSDEQTIQKMLQYVDAHFKEEISRNDLADMFYFDPDYITKIFKREKGLNYKDYIIEKRLELAKKLLTETDTPVRDVSLAVGYDNYSYFTRLFKKKFKITPAEYRKGQ